MAPTPSSASTALSATVLSFTALPATARDGDRRSIQQARRRRRREHLSVLAGLAVLWVFAFVLVARFAVR
jgi:hypothetical protein